MFTYKGDNSLFFSHLQFCQNEAKIREKTARATHLTSIQCHFLKGLESWNSDWENSSQNILDFFCSLWYNYMKSKYHYFKNRRASGCMCSNNYLVKNRQWVCQTLQSNLLHFYHVIHPMNSNFLPWNDAITSHGMKL